MAEWFSALVMEQKVRDSSHRLEILTVHRVVSGYLISSGKAKRQQKKREGLRLPYVEPYTM